MQKEIDEICSGILKKITPTKDEKTKIEALARELEQKVASACAEQGVQAIVRVEGSVAKGTWLREEPDVDIFMRLTTSISRKDLGKTSLGIARKATEGSMQIERFAEHPYLEALVTGVRVNVVPCFAVKRGEWLSATDRTPFHTDYMKSRLNKALQNEVRLLKKFMQGIRVYGAEIKIGGFSGYLCELIILHYKSLTQTLKAFTGYTHRTVVDIENYYAGREKELQLLFAEPLVVIDPVDKGRNVASAVQSQKLHTFIGAARAFLETPSKEFFDPPKTESLSVEALKRKMHNRGSTCVFLTCTTAEAVPDVLWGQLYRTQRSLRKVVELNDFEMLRDGVWSDEKTLSIFILELAQRVLPSVKKHLGPPLARDKECDNFLAKYLCNNNVVSGPYIEDGRWVVELQRRFTDVVEFLDEKLKEDGRKIGVAQLVSEAFKEEYSILINDRICEVYNCNRDFAEFLTEFLNGRPSWLKIAAAHIRN